MPRFPLAAASPDAAVLAYLEEVDEKLAVLGAQGGLFPADCPPKQAQQRRQLLEARDAKLAELRLRARL